MPDPILPNAPSYRKVESKTVANNKMCTHPCPCRGVISGEPYRLGRPEGALYPAVVFVERLTAPAIPLVQVGVSDPDREVCGGCAPDRDAVAACTPQGHYHTILRHLCSRYCARCEE